MEQGKAPGSRRKSKGKVWELWGSRRHSESCKLRSLALAWSQGMKPERSRTHRVLQVMREPLDLNQRVLILAEIEQRWSDGEVWVPFFTGPSCPRFSRERFKSEDAPKIHVALSISLFLLNLAFFINVGQRLKGSKAACWARGAVFHYFLLCAFTWMSLEAFHLYLLVIKVFNTYFSHYFLKLSLVGWGRCLLARQRVGWLCLDEARRGAALGRAMGRGSSHSDWLRAREMDRGRGM